MLRQAPVRRWQVPSALLVSVMTATTPALAQVGGDDCRELVLHNGRIATVDARNTIASSVRIRNGRIAAVGTGRGIPRHDACAKVVDLRGRRVVPGLIDSHSHFLLLGLRPGHDTRLDAAASVAEAQQLIRARAKGVKAGEWLTAISGWHPGQFAEKRMPTLGELDAAAPNHPVFVLVGFAGPSNTNTLGKTFLQSKGVSVGTDGGIAANEPSIAALNALRSIQTFEDQKRGTLDTMAYSASVGLTTHMDMGGAWAPNPAWEGAVQVSNGSTNLMDPVAGYQPIVALHREGKLPVRLRLFLYTQDLKPELTFLRQRLNNPFRDFGDDWMRVSGLGEWILGSNLNAPPPQYETAARLVAEKGWAYHQHASGLEDARAITGVWEKVNATIPLANLRWCLAHVPAINQQTISRLKAIGVGVSAGGGRYLAGTREEGSPPFRMLVDSGIRVGYGGDGANIAPLNPWPHMYYMVTGKNAAGEVINGGQTVSRIEALRLYTAGNAWFTKDENNLGSIEVGKLGDLVVLSDDFLDPARVPDEAIKRLSSVLTVVAGRIVHDDGVLGTR